MARCGKSYYLAQHNDMTSVMQKLYRPCPRRDLSLVNFPPPFLTGLEISGKLNINLLFCGAFLNPPPQEFLIPSVEGVWMFFGTTSFSSKFNGISFFSDYDNKIPKKKKKKKKGRKK